MKRLATYCSFCIYFFLIQISAQTFTDNVSADNIGDFPANFNLLKGSAEVAAVGGKKAIKLGGGAIITPKIDTTDYLGNTFKIELNLYFDEVKRSITYQKYELRFWPGTGAGKAAGLSFRPLRVYRHGASLNIVDKGPGSDREFKNYLKELETKNPTWRNLVIEYNNGSLKVEIDQTLILNIPDYGPLQPSQFSVEANSNDGEIELLKGIADIQINGTTSPSNSQGQPSPSSTTTDTASNNSSATPTYSGNTTSNGQGEVNLPGQNGAPDFELDRDGIRDGLYGGLEAVVENEIMGWRLKGMDPENYGNIGKFAVDISYSDSSVRIYGATGSYSFASGWGTIASDAYSTAMGQSTTASGDNSTAMGSVTEASGKNSTAMGYYTNASGIESTAMGSYTTASGSKSTAMGSSNEASGIASTAMGYDTNASGTFSTAMGKSTSAVSYASTAIGKHNVDNGNPTEWIPTDPIFIIGNGDTNERSNAFAILKNGNAKLAGTLRQNSDARLKENLASLKYGLKHIVSLKPVSYTWKKYPDQKNKSFGLIAQDVQKIMPELVSEDDDVQKTLSLSYTELIPVLINAIKEQNTIIENLEKDNTTYKTNMEALNDNFKLLSQRIQQLELNTTN